MNDVTVAGGNRWVDEDWRRDWLFWTGVAGGVSLFALRLPTGNGPWWWDLLGLVFGFAVTVAVLGFIRTAARAYRS